MSRFGPEKVPVFLICFFGELLYNNLISFGIGENFFLYKAIKYIIIKM